MLGQRPVLASLASVQWDLVVIGGGITGAGVALEAARRGKRTLLLEQRDFAWGTSSRSSKMVHGGLRYIAQGDVKLTRHSLMERERLLQEAPSLVVRQHYLFPIRKGEFPGRWPLKLVLTLYDLLAGIWDHRWVPRAQVLEKVPGLEAAGLRGAMTYTDALTDDARLVLRVLHEAVSHQAVVGNYLKVKQVEAGAIGVRLEVQDELEYGTATLQARCVINATGAWADNLSGERARVRPQRGSHLIVSAERLSVKHCMTLLHPDDGRPVFVFPWEGRTCIGTTDLDHTDSLNDEPRCTAVEVDYLLKLVNRAFPAVKLEPGDIISTMAGVRPIIASGKGVNPSKERRDHAVWGVPPRISVSGDKLTTFRLIALDALLAAGMVDAEERQLAEKGLPLFTRDLKVPHSLGHPLAPLPDEQTLLAQVRWVLEQEMVAHLDDLMLRRTRLGNLLEHGGAGVLEQILSLCCQALGWDENRAVREKQRYLDIIQSRYSVPAPAAEALG